jgi:hypothetical protein
MVPYQRPDNSGGILVSLIIMIVLMATLLGACGLITNSAASMVDSGASVANTWTQESNATTRTRIEWSARVDMKELDVEIATINADAQRKTDFTFLLFWVTRFLFVAATICAIVAGSIYAANLLKAGGHEQTTTTVN